MSGAKTMSKKPMSPPSITSQKIRKDPRPKIWNLKQIKSKKHRYIEGLPPWFVDSFGEVTMNFVWFIWAESGSGKTNMVMQVLKLLMNYGKVLYVALEEGGRATMQRTINRQDIDDSYLGRIQVTEPMSLEWLYEILKKRNSGQFVVIDSTQYLAWKYDDYKRFKTRFLNKTLIIISHADGKNPRGTTAQSIRYDADVKTRVEGCVAFTRSRFDGGKNYVIHEEGAKKYWGKKYKTIIKE